MIPQQRQRTLRQERAPYATDNLPSINAEEEQEDEDLATLLQNVPLPDP